MCAVYFFLLFLLQVSASGDTVSHRQFIRDGESVVSAGGTFELKFFNLSNPITRYLGIWFKKESASAVVWVANRENPLKDSSGALTLTAQGVLLLLNGENNTIWSSNSTRNTHGNPVMQLLESGNLVVKEGNDSNQDNYIWQSFDHPCDTLLPGMKLGKDLTTGLERFLTSWKTADNPARGQFSYWVDLRGFPQLVVKNGTSFHYRLGSWNGLRFTGTPDLPTNVQFFEYEFVMNKKEVYYRYAVRSLLQTRLIVNRSGFLPRFVRTDQSIGWKLLYEGPVDQCDDYSVCGAHMICNIIGNSPACNCLEGFVSENPKNWSKGCVRKTNLYCKTDVFLNYTRFKLPDTSSSWFNTSMNLEECKEMCRRNCSCTAYANSDVTGQGSGCLLWFGDLLDMRVYDSGGQDLFIRMAPSKPGHKKKLVEALASSAALIGLLMLGFVCCICSKKHRKKGKHFDFGNKEGEEDMELPIIDLDTIVKATDNFSSSNKLGQGGFGPVYKGTLINGQQIAVKRLSKSSGQGINEFKNEVILIAKLQHRNLVKLLGCCIQGDETMLIYEFMPNKSLDHFIFDQTRKEFLDWNQRILIIDGIARGLLYLHQDSRLRIVHRDLKASNVLLDAKMNPKISDFGLARMFGADQMEANTINVVGTYGYMSPEYAIDGLFSTKSDVFSFGVLVLEIVSGKKNRGFSHPDHSHNLTGHAWILWTEGRPLELVDNTLADLDSKAKVLRCIHVGLLCVQQRPVDRPDISSVVLMLGSETQLPQPKQPGFFTERNMPELNTSAGKNESTSTNEMSLSLLEPR